MSSNLISTYYILRDFFLHIPFALCIDIDAFMEQLFTTLSFFPYCCEILFIGKEKVAFSVKNSRGGG